MPSPLSKLASICEHLVAYAMLVCAILTVMNARPPKQRLIQNMPRISQNTTFSAQNPYFGPINAAVSILYQYITVILPSYTLTFLSILGPVLSVLGLLGSFFGTLLTYGMTLIRRRKCRRLPGLPGQGEKSALAERNTNQALHPFEPVCYDVDLYPSTRKRMR